MIQNQYRTPGHTESARTGSWRGDVWRHARSVLDDYDEDRVLAEWLADDLVNELAARPARRGRPRRGRPRLTTVASAAPADQPDPDPAPVDRAARGSAPRHLRLVREISP